MHLQCLSLRPRLLTPVSLILISAILLQISCLVPMLLQCPQVCVATVHQLGETTATPPQPPLHKTTDSSASLSSSTAVESKQPQRVRQQRILLQLFLEPTPSSSGTIVSAGQHSPQIEVIYIPLIDSFMAILQKISVFDYPALFYTIGGGAILSWSLFLQSKNSFSKENKRFARKCYASTAPTLVNSSTKLAMRITAEMKVIRRVSHDSILRESVEAIKHFH